MLILNKTLKLVVKTVLEFGKSWPGPVLDWDNWLRLIEIAKKLEGIVQIKYLPEIIQEFYHGCLRNGGLCDCLNLCILQEKDAFEGDDHKNFINLHGAWLVLSGEELIKSLVVFSEMMRWNRTSDPRLHVYGENQFGVMSAVRRKSKRNPGSAHQYLLSKKLILKWYLGLTHSRDLVEMCRLIWFLRKISLYSFFMDFIF